MLHGLANFLEGATYILRLRAVLCRSRLLRHLVSMGAKSTRRRKYVSNCNVFCCDVM